MKYILKINLLILVAIWGLAISPWFCISGNHLHDRDHHSCKHQHEEEPESENLDIHCDNSIVKPYCNPRQLGAIIAPTVCTRLLSSMDYPEPIAHSVPQPPPRLADVIPLLN